MNKKDAVKKFRAEVMPTVRQEEQEKNGGEPNYPRRAQYWRKFLEIMHERGEIRDFQMNWKEPDFCRELNTAEICA
jgi:hypothetical protein